MNKKQAMQFILDNIETVNNALCSYSVTRFRMNKNEEGDLANKLYLESLQFLPRFNEKKDGK